MTYRVLNGINWTRTGETQERRAEIGQLLDTDDLKGSDVAWFLSIGALEKIKVARPKVEKREVG